MKSFSITSLLCALCIFDGLTDKVLAKSLLKPARIKRVDFNKNDRKVPFVGSSTVSGKYKLSKRKTKSVSHFRPWLMIKAFWNSLIDPSSVESLSDDFSSKSQIRPKKASSDSR